MTRPSAGFVGALSGIAAFVLAAIAFVVLRPAPPPIPPIVIQQPAVAPPPAPATPTAAREPERLPELPPGVVARAIPGASITSMVDLFRKVEVQLERAPDVGGVPRLFGQHADKLTMVELSGHGDALESGSVVVALPNDSRVVLTRNTAALLIFLGSTGWADGTKWTTDAMSKGHGTTTHRGVTFELATYAGVEGAFILSAKPAAIPTPKIISNEEAMAQAIARAKAATARNSQGIDGGSSASVVPPVPGK